MASENEEVNQDCTDVIYQRSHRTPLTIWREFSGSTSMHGVGRAVGSKTVWKKVVWSLLVTAGLGFAMYNVATTLSNYMSFPTSTSITVEYQPIAKFPAVTICNNNKFVMSSISEHYNLTKIIRDWKETYGPQNPRDYLSFPYFELGSVSIETLEKWGHSMSEMLIDCRYSGEPCNATDFQLLYDTKYGNCYSFNAIFSRTNDRYSTFAGMGGGLSLEFDIQQDLYIPLTEYGGLKVLIHDPSEMPFPEHGGFLVAPGFATNVGIRKTVIKRAPYPYSDCVHLMDEKSSGLDMFTGAYGSHYSPAGCRKTCYQNMVYYECGCCDDLYPCIEELLLKTGRPKYDETEDIPTCSILAKTDNTTISCQLRLMDLERKGKLECNAGDIPPISACNVPCEENDYTVSLSTSVFPSEAYIEDFMEKASASALAMNKSFSYGKDDKKEMTKLVMVRLNVFYEQLSYEKIKTEPLYTWNRLLGDIGGQLGLCLGFSLLTAIECVELVYDVVISLLWFGNRINPEQKKSEPDIK